MKMLMRAGVCGAVILALVACGQTGSDAPSAAAAAQKETPDNPRSAPVADGHAQESSPTAITNGDASKADAPRRGRQREWMASLSESQRSGLRDLRQRTASQLATLRNEQGTQQEAFHDALVSGDRSKALAASSLLAEMAANAEQMRLDEMIELSELLTPEQRGNLPQQLMNGGQRAGRPGGRRRAAAGASDGN